tara:strand:- start:231 stop:974 length:744 start_codon:yes stop_codon:yes gene_type:complete
MNKDDIIHGIGKRLGNPIFRMRTKNQSKHFSKDIQHFLKWYSNNEKFLEDEIKSGLHMGQLLEFIEDTNDLSSSRNECFGNIMELGVFRGGTSICFAKFLKQIKSQRHVFACDTFEGFPYDDIRNEEYNSAKNYMQTSDYENVSKKFQKFNVDDKIKILKGAFEDTLYQKLSNEKFSFVFADADLYKSTKFSLEFLKSRMCEGGIITFHNYGESNLGVWGETDAVDEFCHENNMKLHTEKSLPYLKF